MVDVEIRMPLRARIWIRAMTIVAPIIGHERAYRWAHTVGYRLMRMRIGRGRWTPLPERT